MIEFKASGDEIRQLAVNAINASSPVGMGIIDYKDKTYTAANLGALFTVHGHVHIDYFEGRMVKLVIRLVGQALYQMRDDLRADYETWMPTYPTVPDLLKSAGITEYRIIE